MPLPLLFGSRLRPSAPLRSFSFVWIILYRNQMLQEPENVKMISPKIFEFFAAEAKVEKVTEKE